MVYIMLEKMILILPMVILYLFCLFSGKKFLGLFKKNDSSSIDIGKKDIHLLEITFIFLAIMSLIFFLEFLVNDDPFQKVIIAPLGEEPYKLFVSFVLSMAVVRKQIHKGRKMIILENFNDYFILTSAVIGIGLFGLYESIGYGHTQNIIAHFSFTLIGAAFIVLWFTKVKYPYKSLGFLWIFVSILLHSISNQYANITSVTEDTSYLVGIAVFLRDNTIFSNQTYFTLFLTAIALFLFVVFRISTFIQKRKSGGRT